MLQSQLKIDKNLLLYVLQELEDKEYIHKEEILDGLPEYNLTHLGRAILYGFNDKL